LEEKSLLYSRMTDSAFATIFRSLEVQHAIQETGHLVTLVAGPRDRVVFGAAMIRHDNDDPGGGMMTIPRGGSGKIEAMSATSQDKVEVQGALVQQVDNETRGQP
jgi:hypothetical protein